MQDEQPQGGTPQEETAPAEATPPTSQPEAEPTPASDPDPAQADEPTPQGDDDDAPDADEPGDDVAPEELAQYEQNEPEQPDNVDEEG